MRHCVCAFLVLLLTVLALPSPAQDYGAVRIEEATERARQLVEMALRGSTGKGTVGHHHASEVPKIRVNELQDIVDIQFISGRVSFSRKSGEVVMLFGRPDNGIPSGIKLTRGELRTAFHDYLRQFGITGEFRITEQETGSGVRFNYAPIVRGVPFWIPRSMHLDYHDGRIVGATLSELPKTEEGSEARISPEAGLQIALRAVLAEFNVRNLRVHNNQLVWVSPHWTPEHQILRNGRIQRLRDQHRMMMAHVVEIDIGSGHADFIYAVDAMTGELIARARIIYIGQAGKGAPWSPASDAALFGGGRVMGAGGGASFATGLAQPPRPASAATAGGVPMPLAIGDRIVIADYLPGTGELLFRSGTEAWTATPSQALRTALHRTFAHDLAHAFR